ncbi:MAG: nuclear transport factor 2 family protein [Duncaniella sp.]|nr:nuclear transport factor 2 family protein [Duncaniella sp.]
MIRNIALATAVAVTALSGCTGKSAADSSAECDKQTKTEEYMCKNVSPEDLAGICKAMDMYVKAAVEGDSKVARPAFAEGATISHAEDGKLICLPIQALFDYYDATGKQPASYKVAECSVAGDVAMIRIESVFGETEFSDMFTLVKEGDEWKIVSKVFQAV